MKIRSFHWSPWQCMTELSQWRLPGAVSAMPDAQTHARSVPRCLRARPECRWPTATPAHAKSGISRFATKATVFSVIKKTQLYRFVFFLMRIFHSKTCTNGGNCHIREAVALYSRPSVVFSTEMASGSISNEDRIRVCGKWWRIHEVRSILVKVLCSKSCKKLWKSIQIDENQWNSLENQCESNTLQKIWTKLVTTLH